MELYNEVLLADLLRHGPTVDSVEELGRFMARIKPLLGEYIVDRLYRKSDLSSGGPLVLFGAGAFGRSLGKILAASGVTVDFWADNNPDLHGRLLDGAAILPPDELKKLVRPQVLVAVGEKRGADSISSQLSTSLPDGALVLNPHERLPEIIGIIIGTIYIHKNIDILSKELPRLAQVVDILDDERSRFIYLNSVKARFMLPFVYLQYLLCGQIDDGNAYWALPEFKNNRDAVYIDCGAYIGDTVIRFLLNNHAQSVKKIYAFEPMPLLFQVLRKNMATVTSSLNLKNDVVECLNYGLAEVSGTQVQLADIKKMAVKRLAADFDASGSDNTENDQVFKLVRLDDFLRDVPVTILKADIEGYELDMLKGASNLIQTHRPKLAICLYHEPEDVYEIPLFIKSLVPQYKMAVRLHRPGEFILYCWI